MLYLAAASAALFFALQPPAAAQEGTPAQSIVYVIPVNGMIERALVYMIRRGIREATEKNARAIILDMDTPGGRLDAAEDIIRAVAALPIPTYTYVNPNSISAGAIIAMATDHIYMAPGSKIGDAMPIMLSFIGGPQEMPKSIEEKSVSYVAGLIRTTAQRKGHDAQLAEAMVRGSVEYRIGEDTISKAGELLTLTNVEAERMVDDGKGGTRFLLSEGTLAGLPDLVELAAGPGATVVRMKPMTEERFARWIEAISALLLIGGIIGIYIEFKTPGFGLPGATGIALLAIWFWGHHVAGLAGSAEMLTFVLGVLLLAVEVFLIPGFGITGAAGIALIVLSLFMAMIPRYPGIPPFRLQPADFNHALATLGISFSCAGVAALLLARYLPESRVVRRIALGSSLDARDGYTAFPLQPGLIGRTGVAETPLRPSGIGHFGDERVDVITDGTFLEKGEPIRVVEIHGKRIVVSRARTENHHSAAG